VIHPLNQASVPRTLAWNLACPATAVLQALLHREQQVLGFPLMDENLLTVDNQILYYATMRASEAWFVLIICFVFVLLF
jgi:hypothetical protein